MPQPFHKWPSVIQLLQAEAAPNDARPEHASSPTNRRQGEPFSAYLDRIHCEQFPYDAIDTPADSLREHFKELDLSESDAMRLLSWMAERQGESKDQTDSLRLAQIIAELIACENIGIAVCGLAFAAGLDQACALGSQAQAARRYHVSPVAISRATTKWRAILGYQVSTFARLAKHGDAFSRARQRRGDCGPRSPFAHRYRSTEAARHSGGIYSPHAVRIVFYRTLKQVRDRIPIADWTRSTREAWQAELEPIAKFYSQICAGEKENKSAETPPARNLFEPALGIG